MSFLTRLASPQCAIADIAGRTIREVSAAGLRIVLMRKHRNIGVNMARSGDSTDNSRKSDRLLKPNSN